MWEASYAAADVDAGVGVARPYCESVVVESDARAVGVDDPLLLATASSLADRVGVYGWGNGCIRVDVGEWKSSWMLDADAARPSVVDEDARSIAEPVPV